MSFRFKWPLVPAFIVGHPDRFRGLVEITFAVALAWIALGGALSQINVLLDYLTDLDFSAQPEQTVLKLFYYLIYWWIRITAACLVVAAIGRGLFYLLRFGPRDGARPLTRSGQIDTLLADQVIRPPAGPTPWGLRLAAWLRPPLRQASPEVGRYVSHVLKSIPVWIFWLAVLASPYFFVPPLMKLVGEGAPRFSYQIPVTLYWVVIAAMALRLTAIFLFIPPSLRADVAQRHTLQSDVGLPSAYSERLYQRLANLVKNGRIYEHTSLLLSTIKGEERGKFTGRVVIESPPRPTTAPNFLGAGSLLVGGLIIRLLGFAILLRLPGLVERIGGLIVASPAGAGTGAAARVAAEPIHLGTSIALTLITGLVAVRLGSSLMNWGGRLIGAVGYRSELLALRVSGRVDMTRLDPQMDPESALHPHRGVLAADCQVELSGTVLRSGVNYPGGPRYIWSARVPRRYEAALDERLKYVLGTPAEEPPSNDAATPSEAQAAPAGEQKPTAASAPQTPPRK